MGGYRDLRGMPRYIEVLEHVGYKGINKGRGDLRVWGVHNSTVVVGYEKVGKQIENWLLSQNRKEKQAKPPLISMI